MAAQRRQPNRYFSLGIKAFGAAVLTASALGFYFRNELQAVYIAHQISASGDAESAQWIDQAASLGDAGVGPFTNLFYSDRSATCATAKSCLEKVSAKWEADDPRRVQLARNLAHNFTHFSTPGQAASLNLVSSWIESEISPQSALFQPVAAIIGQAALGIAETGAEPSPAVPQAALALLRKIKMTSPDSKPEERLAQRDLLRQILRKADPGSRVDAIGLAFAGDFDLQDDLTALLQDPVAEVRRGAVLALGPARDKVRDEVLLSALHDNDAEVSRLAELALQFRGLTTEHIKLGKLLTHADASRRLEVLDLLVENPDLDEKLWLQRLSHDRAASVRAAAARAMSQRFGADADERLREMATNDPSPAVTKLARYYLKQQSVRPQ